MVFSSRVSLGATAAAAAVAMLATPVASIPTSFIAAEAPDYNNEIVNELLEASSWIRSDGTGYATFDWDNTCMYGDISHTAWLYHAQNLNFRFTPEEFQTIFALGYNETTTDACLPQGVNSVIGTDVNGTNVTLSAVLSSAAADYEVLYDSYIAATYNLTSNTTAAMTLEQVQQTAEFNNFMAKYSFIGYQLIAADGGNVTSECAMTVSLKVMPMKLYGMTEAEINSTIKASIRQNLGAKLDTLSFTSTGDLQVTGTYTQGVRPFNGQEAVMRALQAQGVAVYIISASPEQYARQAAELFGLGYATTDVYGCRFVFEDGKFTGEFIDNYPITWGPGKATIIEDYLKPMHGDEYPIFASGDSDGDCQMLDTVRDGVVLVNNRLYGNSTCIQGFYEKACKYFNTSEPDTENRYLLQGQDKIIGTWIESGYTTKDGTTFTSGATTNDCSAYKFLSV